MAVAKFSAINLKPSKPTQTSCLRDTGTRKCFPGTEGGAPIRIPNHRASNHQFTTVDGWNPAPVDM